MLKISIGEPIQAQLVRRGTSVKGEYLMVLAGDKKDRLPIWVTNIEVDIKEGDIFCIEKIGDVQIRHLPPSSRFDKWQDEFSVGGTIKKINMNI